MEGSRAFRVEKFLMNLMGWQPLGNWGGPQVLVPSSVTSTASLARQP